MWFDTECGQCESRVLYKYISAHKPLISELFFCFKEPEYNLCLCSVRGNGEHGILLSKFFSSVHIVCCALCTYTTISSFKKVANTEKQGFWQEHRKRGTDRQTHLGVTQTRTHLSVTPHVMLQTPEQRKHTPFVVRNTDREGLTDKHTLSPL